MTYLYDGTMDGFFTAFLRAYVDPHGKIAEKSALLLLGEEGVFVPTNSLLANKAKRRLCSFDAQFAKDFFLLLRCGTQDRDDIAFRYCRLLANEKKPVRNMLSNADARAADDAIRRIGFEIHRLHGFIRFTETASGALYAPFTPDHDICDLLVPHFKARFSEIPFVLHDVKRKKAAFYDGKSVFVSPLQNADVILSKDEENWQALWKRYYQAVNIPERERLKQMRGYMPTRYWTFMPEKQP